MKSSLKQQFPTINKLDFFYTSILGQEKMKVTTVYI